MVNLASITGMLKSISIFPVAPKGLVVQRLTHVYALWVAFACNPNCACKSFHSWVLRDQCFSWKSQKCCSLLAVSYSTGLKATKTECRLLGNGSLTIYGKKLEPCKWLYVTAKTGSHIMSARSERSRRKILALPIVLPCFSGGQHLIYTRSDLGGRLHKLFWFSL